MGIIQNYNEGTLTSLDSLTYKEYGTHSPYVTKKLKDPTLPLFIRKRADDLLRITKMLVNKPGLRYLANEALIEQQNTIEKIENRVKGGLANREIGTSLLQGLSNTTRLIGSTLAQVPVNGTGTHFVRAFNKDTYLGNVEKYKQYSAPFNFSTFSSVMQDLFTEITGEPGIHGAPLARKGKPIGGIPVQTTLEPGTLQKSNDGWTPDKDKKEIRGIPPSTNLTETPGKSPDGIDYSGTPLDENNNLDENNKLKRKRNGYVLNYKSEKINKEYRVGLGNQGAKKTIDSKSITYTSASGKKPLIDKLNALKEQDGPAPLDARRDLIKFRFEVITPDSPSIKYLYFRAYLDSLSDDYNGTWTGTKYIGRGEDMFNYTGFSRNISLSFKIAASTREEMKPLYRKIVYLASTTAPTYGKAPTNFMRGTLVNLTVGSYIVETPGFLENVSYNWNVNYPWEIAMQNPEINVDDDMQEVPQILDCSVSFRPIHTFVPETGLKHYITHPSPSNGASNWLADEVNKENAI